MPALYKIYYTKNKKNILENFSNIISSSSGSGLKYKCSNKFFRKSESIPGNKSSKFHSGRSPRTLDDNEADAGANNFFKIFLTALI